MQVSDQLAWEKECVERGTARYYANQDRLRNQGQSEQTDVVSFLLRDRLEDIAASLEEAANTHKPGIGGKYNRILKSCAIDGDYLRVAYIGIQTAFQILVNDDNNTIMKLSLGISSRLEADLKCAIFEAKHPAYFNKVMESFKDQKVADYVHKHKVMMKKFNDFDLEWNAWHNVQRVQIGVKVIQAILTHFSDVFFVNKIHSQGKSVHKLDTTDEFDKWAAEFEKERGFYFPMMLPLKMPPVAWDGTNSKAGAYYSHKMARRVPLIKTRGNEHKKYVNSHDPHLHRNAINKMQRTAWKINSRVLDVQQEIYNNGLGIGMPSNVSIKPPKFPDHLKDVPKEELTDNQKLEIGDWKALAKAAYGKEQKRKGKVVAFMQSYKLAQELREWEHLYYAYNCDFRGRIYCATAGLSPQGADTARGILHFSKAVALGKDGAYWLAIHGANTYGYDKASYDGRVAWINERADLIRSIAEDPVGNRSLWGNADKPYQFLAFCFEWADSDCGRNTSYRSRIAVALDGSCNGLQHFSAMLRDEVGAGATNLTNVAQPSDIYGEVATVCTEKVWQISVSDDAEHAGLAAIWYRVGIDRKCAKRPVMTLPYGATQQSARLYVLEYVQDNWAKFDLPEDKQWEMASFLTPILWQSIGEVVVAAREAMTWLQKSVGLEFAQWLTPIGFPVYQYYKNVKSIDVRTSLNGGMRLKVQDINDVAEPKKSLQKSGIAPNFVHSIDSTHMVITAHMTDFNSYAMIHDDFGTHAGNTGGMFIAIRKAMLHLYTKFDPLVDWAEQIGLDTSNMPEVGTYNIQEILKADYFFG